MTTESQSSPILAPGHRPPKFENPVAGSEERARELGVELEPLANSPMSFDEIGIPRQRNQVTPRIVNPSPPPAPTPAQAFDAQVTSAEALLVERNAARVAAAEALAEAEQARADAPTDPSTLVALDAAARADRLAELDAKAALKSRDQIVARVARQKASGEFAAFEQKDREQADAGVLARIAPFEVRAGELGEGLGKLVLDLQAALRGLGSTRAEANRLARLLGITNYREGRIDMADAVVKVGVAFKAGFRKASRLPDFAIKRWTGQ
jgi:hypothetical protein